MPELPEVEAARRAVHESCCGRRIVEARVADDSIVVDSVTPSTLEGALVGRTIVGTHRKGKNLWLELDARPWPSFQFGMTGAFNIKGKEVTKYKRAAVSDKEEWPSKFSKVFFKLDDGLEVSFTDKRRLARVRLLDDPIAVPPISQLGPDAFLELPVETDFMSSILKKRCPIKVLLMDQGFVAGIGNWVADEVLYQAKIHPEQTACSLSEMECSRLHKTIQEVLKLSVSVDADSEMFPKNWIFHYRWKKKPGEVEGEKISFITVGGRTSAIVPVLQKCTSEISRKKVIATDEEAENNGVETNKSGVRKKKGRKQKTSISVDMPDDEEKHAVTKNKNSAKDILPLSEAETRKGRGQKKSSSKTMEAEKEDKVSAPKGKNAARVGKKQGMTPAKKRYVTESKEEEITTSTTSAAHIEVGNKTSVKSTKQSSNSLKKKRGQKRKRGANSGHF